MCVCVYYELNGEYFIDFSILVNHAFQDGYHISLLINELQEMILKINVDSYLKGVVYVKKK